MNCICSIGSGMFEVCPVHSSVFEGEKAAQLSSGEQSPQPFFTEEDFRDVWQHLKAFTTLEAVRIANAKTAPLLNELTDLRVTASAVQLANDDLKERITRLEEALRFYANEKGEHWAACRPEDTKDTCCHMIAEIKGGERARAALGEK